MLRIIETMALAIWVGAMAAFAFIFAPVAFHVIPDLDVFSRLVGATLTRLSYVGFVCAALIAFALIPGAGSRSRTIRMCCLAVMIATSAYELLVIMPEMQRILGSAGGSLKSLAPDHPIRTAYDAVHHRSSGVYGTTLLAGLVALTLRALDTARTAGSLRSTTPGEH